MKGKGKLIRKENLKKADLLGTVADMTMTCVAVEEAALVVDELE